MTLKMMNNISLKTQKLETTQKLCPQCKDPEQISGRPYLGLQCCSMYELGGECRLSSIPESLFLKKYTEKGTLTSKDAYIQSERVKWWAEHIMGTPSLMFFFCLCFSFAWLITGLSTGVRFSVVSLLDVMTHKTVSLLSEQEQKYGLLPRWKAVMCCSCLHATVAKIAWHCVEWSAEVPAKQAAKTCWIAFLQTTSNCKCSEDMWFKEAK